ncbi:MAG: hypothetical protein WB586_28340 [Chthoniobacterales bacterium]
MAAASGLTQCWRGSPSKQTAEKAAQIAADEVRRFLVQAGVGRYRLFEKHIEPSVPKVTAIEGVANRFVIDERSL